MAGPRPAPAAEFRVSPELVQQLLAAQHPDLAHLPVTVLASGWDNLMCRLGDDLIVRLPRRAMAARLAEHEQRWLPVLAPRLPLAVPAPVRTGRPGLGYPWPWSVVPFLPGQIAARNPPAGFGDAAASLGGFLGALHTPAMPGAPVSAVRGIPLADRREADLKNLGALDGLVDRQAVLRAWDAALAAPRWHGPPVWLHGDLHPANILVHQGRISGVIDFGDINGGDPAGDLSVAWMLLPARCRGLFRDAYAAAGGAGAGAGIGTGTGPGGGAEAEAGDAAWARARGWALVLSLAFLAHSAGNPLMAKIGERTLAAVLADRAGG